MQCNFFLSHFGSKQWSKLFSLGSMKVLVVITCNWWSFSFQSCFLPYENWRSRIYWWEFSNQRCWYWFLRVYWEKCSYCKSYTLPHYLFDSSNISIVNILFKGRRCILKDCCMIEDNTILPPETVVPSFTKYNGSPGRCVGELPECTQELMTEFTRSYYQHFIPEQT